MRCFKSKVPKRSNLFCSTTEFSWFFNSSLFEYIGTRWARAYFLILLNEQLQNWFFTVHAKSPNWHDSVIRNDFSFSFHKKWNPVRNNRYINSSRSAWRSKQRQLKAYLVISCEEDLNKRRNTHTTKSCAIHTT